jgi:hypothetical protein
MISLELRDLPDSTALAFDGAAGAARLPSSKAAFVATSSGSVPAAASTDLAFSFVFTARHDHGALVPVCDGGFYGAQSRAIAQARDASDALFKERINAAKAAALAAPPPKKARASDGST